MVSLLPPESAAPRARSYTIHLPRASPYTPAPPASNMSAAHHNYNFALQKYMLLQEQHEELCIHLDQIRPGMALGCPNGAAAACSPSTSPTRTSSFSSTLSTTSSHSSSSSSSPPPPSPRRHSRGGGGERRHSRPQARCSGWGDRGDEALGTIVDEETLYEISAEEQRLCGVNEGIKRALTELLNCDAVRCDGQMRMWVQRRLMETEKELRSGRRRKGSME